MAFRFNRNQKFTAFTASIALTASVVAPFEASAVTFSDTKGNSHEEAINTLVKEGIISGYADGTFKPNKTLSRSDVVKIMGKWLVSLGFAVPADYKTNLRFTDLTSSSNEELLKYAALVKDHGVFVGTPDGKLNPTGDISRENMALVLVRAYDAVHKTDLVSFVSGQSFAHDVNDRDLAKSEARPYVDVLDYFDITNPQSPMFNPKNTTTRGQFASFLMKTLRVKIPSQEINDPIPVWKYNGNTTIYIKNGDRFTIPEVNAQDHSGKNVQVTSIIKDNTGKILSSIDTTVSGTYTITYSATDAAGNKARDLVISVIVAPPIPETNEDLEVISIS